MANMGWSIPAGSLNPLISSLAPGHLGLLYFPMFNYPPKPEMILGCCPSQSTKSTCFPNQSPYPTPCVATRSLLAPETRWGWPALTAHRVSFPLTCSLPTGLLSVRDWSTIQFSVVTFCPQSEIDAWPSSNPWICLPTSLTRLVSPPSFPRLPLLFHNSANLPFDQHVAYIEIKPCVHQHWFPSCRSNF